MKTKIPWRYHNPVSVVVTEDFLSVLESMNLKGNTLLITGSHVTKSGLSQTIIDKLQSTKISLYDKGIVNPDIELLDSLHERYSQKNFTNIVAIGGGSVLDTAKVLSLTIPIKRKGVLSSYFRDKEEIDFKASINLIGIPTTSGTGSECTPFSTVWDKRHFQKYSLESVRMVPKLSILDPTLTLSLPYEQTLFTGLDALSHAVESLWNNNRTPISEMYSLEAIKHIHRSFIPLLEKLDDVTHRSRMQYASFCAGMAISNTKTALAHAISYPLSLHYDMPHGLACSFTLAAIVKMTNISQKLTGEVKEAIDNSVSIVEQLSLKEYLKNYISQEELLALNKEMCNPSRFNNFATLIDLTTLISILETSYR